MNPQFILEPLRKYAFRFWKKTPVWNGKKISILGISRKNHPGDKERTLTSIVKIVSGDDKILGKSSKLYETIISAGVHRASSIKVAEAAKVIENTQRDLNIALINELAIIFDKLEIDTLQVLQAAGTNGIFFHSVLAGRGTLHWCGSLLSYPQSRYDWLSSSSDTSRTPHK